MATAFRRSCWRSPGAARSRAAKRKERTVLQGRVMNRRALLKGLIALPLLDAMTPSFSRAAVSKAASPCRMAFLYVPNGIMMDQWTPARTPGVTPLPPELPRITSALAPFRDDITLIGGLAQN